MSALISVSVTSIALPSTRLSNFHDFGDCLFAKVSRIILSLSPFNDDVTLGWVIVIRPNADVVALHESNFSIRKGDFVLMLLSAKHLPLPSDSVTALLPQA